MFGLTTRGELPASTQREFERLYARLSEFLAVSFDENGNLLVSTDTTRVVGEVIDFAGSTPPDKWLLCDGSQVSRITYKSLFEVIGTTYGAGDGSTTFNLPDCRGRFSLAKSTSGTGSVLGETGGSLDHTHAFSGVSISGTTSANGGHGHSASSSADGAHSHSQSGNTGFDVPPNGEEIGVTTGSDASVSAWPHTHPLGAATISTEGSHSHTITVSSVSDHTHTFSATGSGTTDDSNPAYIVFNRIIYTGVSA
jgi:microcystin-dependent protein